MPGTSQKTGELAPHADDQPLDRNGYRSYESLPPMGRTPRKRAAVWPRLVLPFVVAAVCGTGAFVVSNFYMTKWYTTGESIWFPGTGSQGNGILSLIGGASADSSGSVPILGGLYSSPQFGSGTNTAITALDSGRCKAKVMTKLDLARRWHLPPDQAGDRFNKNVTYGIDKNGLLTVQANDTDPRTAQQIVVAYVQAMREVSTELSISFAHRNLVAVRQKYESANAQLMEQESELVALQRRTAKALPLGSASNGAYVDLVNERTATQIDLNTTLAEIAAQQQNAKSAYSSGLSLPLSVPFAQDTMARLRKAESDFAQVKSVYGPDYPGYREAQDRLTQAQADAKSEMQRQLSATQKGITPDLSALYVKQASLQARLDALNQATAAREADVLSLPQAQMREADLAREVGINTDLVKTLAQGVQQAELAEQRDVPTFEVVDGAGVPGQPSLPRVGFTTALAAVAGFLLTLSWLAASTLLRQPASMAQIRRWSDAYGLTDGEEEELLEGLPAAALSDHRAAQLPASDIPDERARQEAPARLTTEEQNGKRLP